MQTEAFVSYFDVVKLGTFSHSPRRILGKQTSEENCLSIIMLNHVIRLDCLFKKRFSFAENPSQPSQVQIGWDPLYKIKLLVVQFPK